MKIDVPVKTVSRFIALMRELNANGPLTLAQLAKCADMDDSTTSRTVQTMLHHGLVERTADTKVYSVAVMALSLSHGFQHADRLAAASQSSIAALTQRIGWPVAIMTRSGMSMVARASTHHLTPQAFGPCVPGTSVPVLHSASGHAFLAHASRNECKGVLRGLQGSEASSPMLDSLVNGDLLERVRADGHATYERNAHAAFPGKTSSISVPVLLAGELQGTLTAIFFSSAMSIGEALRRYRIDLCDAAASIEAALKDFAQPSAMSNARAHPRAAWPHSERRC